jgi:hypothetical protein
MWLCDRIVRIERKTISFVFSFPMGKGMGHIE